jgi:hypothetical protein
MKKSVKRNKSVKVKPKSVKVNREKNRKKNIYRDKDYCYISCDI